LGFTIGHFVRASPIDRALLRRRAFYLSRAAKSKTERQTMNDGEKLLLARRRKGLAAWKFAALADLDPTTYSRIERGDREATFEQKLALARALGVPVEQIFERISA
jgi:DNA-binding XRE family transcriptional regulator